MRHSGLSVAGVSDTIVRKFKSARSNYRSKLNRDLKGGGQECPPYTFVVLGQIYCILSLLWIGDVKGCKVPLLFAFPRRDWRERGLSDKLLGGEIDVHVRIVRFAGASDGAFLLVLRRGHGVGRRTSDYGVRGVEAPTIGEGGFGIAGEAFEFEFAEFVGWPADGRPLSSGTPAGGALSHHCVAGQRRHGRGVPRRRSDTRPAGCAEVPPRRGEPG